jgi:hypothetical protein
MATLPLLWFLLSSGALSDTAAAVLAAPPPSPWRNAMAVTVDNNPAAAAQDVPDCGIVGKPRCLTIRYGVSRALPNATVSVRGGGTPYTGECGGGGDAWSSPSGIQPPAGASLAVVAGAGGPVIIDCEGKGRGFRFNASSTAAVPAPNVGATFRLVGLEFRNGNSSAAAWPAEASEGGAVWASGGVLEVLDSTFANCKALGDGGALHSVDARLIVNGSSFANIVAGGSSAQLALGGGGAGGAMYVRFNSPLAELTSVSIDSSNFTETEGASGGAAYMVFAGNLADTTVSVSRSRFTNTSTHKGGGGGLSIRYGAGNTTIANTGVTTIVEGCTFDNATCSRGNTGGGMRVYFNSPALNPVTRLQGCTFSKCHVAFRGQGSGFDITFQEGVSGALTHFDHCNFTDARGSAVHAKYGIGKDVTTTISNSTFQRVNTTGHNGGGGASINFDAALSNTVTRILDSSFLGCASGEKSAGDVGSGGGGASITYGSIALRDSNSTVAENAAVIVRGTRFENNTVSGASGGGGFLVQVLGSSENTSLELQASTFVRNVVSGVGGGGGASITHDGASYLSKVVVDSAAFENNDASGSGGSGGGGMLVQFLGDNVASTSVVVQHTAFVGNTAGGTSGGGGMRVQHPEDKPQNLHFVGLNGTSIWWKQDMSSAVSMPLDLNFPCTGPDWNCSGNCSGCPRFQLPGVPSNDFPISPVQDVYRRWAYSNTLAIRDSNFSSNKAIHQGGAIAIATGSTGGGGDGSIERCLVEGNHASLYNGGGLSIGGTAQLSVLASTMRENTCGQRGSQLFSASGAGITFGSGSRIDLGCGDGASECTIGILAMQAGNVTWIDASAMACPAGYVLLNTSTTDSTQDPNWKIEPPQALPALPNSNCPCYFSYNATNPPQGGFDSATIYPPIRVSTLSFACLACPAGKFNPEPPTLGAGGNATTIGECTQCPYGADCTRPGRMVAVRGFWGNSSALTAFRCPVGYCCDSDNCSTIDGCMGNRNRASPLCGSCAPGYSQTIGSTACRLTSECGSTDAVWFVPSMLLLSLAYTALVLEISKDTGTGSCNSSEGGGRSLDAIRQLFYFYQMATMLPVGALAQSTAVVLFTSLANMRLRTSSNGFACPFPGLTTLQAEALYFAVPVIIAVMLALCFYAKKKFGSSGSAESSSIARRQQFQVAGVKTAMLAYSTVLGTTFQFLHCIDNPGGEGGRVLFFDATKRCTYQWQVPCYLLALLLLLPVALTLVAAARGHTPYGLHRIPLTQAAAVSLTAPYRDDCGHWEAVLALQRLVMVALHSFVTKTAVGAGALLQVVVCVVALAVHLLWQPFATCNGNRAQTVLLLSLVAVALLNVPQALLDSNAEAISSTMQDLLRQARVIEAVLILTPGILVGMAVLRLAWRWRRELAQRLFACCCCHLLGVQKARSSLEERLLDRGPTALRPGGKTSVFKENDRGLRLTFSSHT